MPSVFQFSPGEFTPFYSDGATFVAGAGHEIHELPSVLEPGRRGDGDIGDFCPLGPLFLHRDSSLVLLPTLAAESDPLSLEVPV